MKTPGGKADRSIAEAFTALYRQENQRQVQRAALVLGSNDAANDVVHDAFAKILNQWQSLEDPAPYLHRMVLNGCRDHLRRQKRLNRLLPRLVDRSPPPANELLDDVLASLPFFQRAVVVLRFYEGMSEAQIAATLACPTGSVGPSLTRAMKKMREAINET